MSPKNLRLKKNKKVFYVGSPTVDGSDYLSTLEGAIKKAIDNARKTGTDQIVVQIVRRVKIAPAPVKVTTV